MRVHSAENSDAGPSVSDGGYWPAGHKGSHPAAVKYGAETLRSSLRPSRKGALSAALCDRSSDLRASVASVTSPLSSGSLLSAASETCDRWSAARTAYMVVALP